MREVKFLRGTNTTVDFAANRSMTVKPQIKKEYYQDGKRMYKTIDGRTFIADVFDHNFNPAVKFKMKGKHFKANSIDPRVIY